MKSFEIPSAPQEEPEKIAEAEDDATSPESIDGDTESREEIKETSPLAEAEIEMLEGLFQEELASVVDSELEERAQDMEDPTEYVDDKDTQKEYIESKGMSAFMDKLPKKVKRTLQAFTMASIFAGGFSAAVVPQQAEAAGYSTQVYSIKDQVKTYRKSYSKEKDRIRNEKSRWKKARKNAAQRRTKHSFSGYHQRQEISYLRRDITYDARDTARHGEAERQKIDVGVELNLYNILGHVMNRMAQDGTK